MNPRVAAPFLRRRLSTRLCSFLPLLFLIMSQSRSQSAAAASLSPFARIQYEGVLRDLPTLQGSLKWVADKGTALSWAELFGKLMVCRRLPFLQFRRGLTGPRVTLGA